MLKLSALEMFIKKIILFLLALGQVIFQQRLPKYCFLFIISLQRRIHENCKQTSALSPIFRYIHHIHENPACVNKLEP